MKNSTRNSLVAFGFLIFAVVGCGENNNGYTNNNANSCQNQPGYVWNGSSCVLNSNYNNGLNTGINNGIPQQYCVAPNVWNTATATCTTQTTGVAGVSQIGTPQNQMYQITPAQNCPTGQYFNGTTCAATVAYQGNCANGQINTQAYGCVQQATQCQSQYSYLNGSSCTPAPVMVASCKSQQVRRGGRVIIIRNGCPNDCSGNYGGTPRKIKFNKDGTIKKIKY